MPSGIWASSGLINFWSNSADLVLFHNLWLIVQFPCNCRKPLIGLSSNLVGQFIMGLQTCQPLRISRNHYAFWVSNTPLRKPVQNVGKWRILRNFGAIRPIPRNLQQLSWLAVSRKSPGGQNIDKDLFILRLPSAPASDFAIRSTKEAAEVKSCPMKRRADREPF